MTKRSRELMNMTIFLETKVQIKSKAEKGMI